LSDRESRDFSACAILPICFCRILFGPSGGIMIEGSRHRMAHPQEARMSRFRTLHFALVGALCWVALVALTPATARAAEVTAADVLDSIERGKKFLLNNQVRDRSKNDGSWNANERDN